MVSKYETSVAPKLAQIEKWARSGFLDREIARMLGISCASFTKYEKQHPELADTLRKGREIADAEVTDALYRCAVGFQYQEITQELEKNKATGEGKLVETKIVTKQVPPDVKAQLLWLKSRKPQQWGEKPEETSSKDITVQVELTDD